jgi:hypothetical protein
MAPRHQLNVLQQRGRHRGLLLRWVDRALFICFIVIGLAFLVQKIIPPRFRYAALLSLPSIAPARSVGGILRAAVR